MKNVNRKSRYRDDKLQSEKLFENLALDELITAEELAKRLNVAVKTVRKWRYENVLPADSMVKLRYQVRYRWGKVLRWLDPKGV